MTNDSLRENLPKEDTPNKFVVICIFALFIGLSIFLIVKSNVTPDVANLTKWNGITYRQKNSKDGFYIFLQSSTDEHKYAVMETRFELIAIDLSHCQDEPLIDEHHNIGTISYYDETIPFRVLSEEEYAIFLVENIGF